MLVDLHADALADGEAGLCEPGAAEAEDGEALRPDPEAVVVVVAVGVGGGEVPLFARLAGACGHVGSLEIVRLRPLFRGAAGCLNTALGRPAVFPFRVLYGCAPPGHGEMSPESGQHESFGHKKTA